ncbi:histidine phosphatase family protein [Massilia sp. UMI-21]|nr:histidine phosphatase family protein [Massilia sp. UMI-21]
MRLSTRLFHCLSLSIAMLASGAALAEPSAVYLVRHGEKASVGQDPELTAQGQARAQAIATILSKTGISAVFSSPTQRTRQTAQPLARHIGLEVQLYDPRAPKALVEKVKALSGPVLVVGHSNTLPELVRLFGGAPGADIGDDEYDRLYQLSPGAGGAVRTVLLSTPTAP